MNDSRGSLDAARSAAPIAELLGIASGSALDAIYRAIIDQTPDGVLLIEPHSKRLLHCNPALQRMLGYSAEEMATLSLYDIVEHDPAIVHANAMRVVETGDPFVAERKYRCKGGDLVDVEVSVTRFTHAGGQALCGIVRDLTERKRIDALLRRTSTELQAIVHATPDLYFRIGADGTYLDVHAGHAEDLMLPAEELLGRRIPDVLPPPVGARMLEMIQAALASGAPVEFEFSLPLQHGEQYFHARFVPLSNDQVFVLARNVTEMRRRSEALRLSQRNLETLIHSIDGIVWEADPKTFRMTFVSKQAERILGYPLARWVEEPTFWADHVHPDDREEAVGFCKRATTEKRDHQFVYRMIAADGRIVWIDDVTSVIVENGEVTRMMGVLVDVTERRRAEEQLHRVEGRLRTLVNNAPVILFSLDDRGVFTLVEGKGLEALGMRPRELIGKSVNDLYRNDPALLNLLRQALAGEMIHASMEFKAGPGKGRTFDLRCAPIQGADQRVQSVIGVATDISDRRQAEEGLRRMEERLRTVVSNAPIVVFALDLDGVFTLSEGRGLKALGVEPGEVVGRSVFEVYRDDPEVVASARRALAGESFSSIFEVTAGPGAGMTHETQWVPLFGEDGRISGVIGVATDLTETKRLETKVRHITLHDSLTGLPNWALFKDRLAQSVQHASRNQEVLAVLLLDIDRFKLVNDTLGHSVGERLLQEVADRLKASIGPADTVARMGGDEFVLLQMGIAHAGEAARMAQRVLEAIKPPYRLDGHDLHVSMSIGISLFPYDGEDPQTLLKNADTAMYHAKETARSSYHFYSPAMNAKAFEKLALENSLRRALEQGEFVVHYQPQVDIRSGKMIGMEALARWRHPDLGLVAPSKFIPLAEDTGVIVPLGEWILRAACTQNKAWQDAGLPPVRVAVNLSARQFQQADLVDVVVRIVRETGLDPQYLEFEITESIAMKDPEYTGRVLKAFKKIGVQISIDDFGIGYSSLSSLKSFPLDSLKIDRSFIQDLNTDPIDAAIATALIALGHRLNMRVVAEGVETEEQLRTLLALDCDMMQGHYFCRPVPPDELGELLARGTRLFKKAPERGGDLAGAAGGA